MGMDSSWFYLCDYGAMPRVDPKPRLPRTTAVEDGLLGGRHMPAGPRRTPVPDACVKEDRASAV